MRVVSVSPAYHPLTAARRVPLKRAAGFSPRRPWRCGAHGSRRVQLHCCANMLAASVPVEVARRALLASSTHLAPVALNGALLTFTTICALSVMLGAVIYNLLAHLSEFFNIERRTRAQPFQVRRELFGVDVSNCQFFQDELVLFAVDFAAEAHQGQTRKTGEPYVTHCIETALIVGHNLPRVSGGEDAETVTERYRCAVIAALLHDVIDDTPVELSHIQHTFGEVVATMVSKVSKLSSINQLIRRGRRKGWSEYSSENFKQLRNMIVDMVFEEPLVILVKLADRLHNMRTVYVLPPDKQRSVAEETQEVWCSMAESLGWDALKSEMEDLCFAVTDADKYCRLRCELDLLWSLPTLHIVEERGGLNTAGGGGRRLTLPAQAVGARSQRRIRADALAAAAAQLSPSEAAAATLAAASAARSSANATALAATSVAEEETDTDLNLGLRIVNTAAAPQCDLVQWTLSDAGAPDVQFDSATTTATRAENSASGVGPVQLLPTAGSQVVGPGGVDGGTGGVAPPTVGTALSGAVAWAASASAATVSACSSELRRLQELHRQQSHRTAGPGPQSTAGAASSAGGALWVGGGAGPDGPASVTSRATSPLAKGQIEKDRQPDFLDSLPSLKPARSTLAGVTSSNGGGSAGPVAALLAATSALAAPLGSPPPVAPAVVLTPQQLALKSMISTVVPFDAVTLRDSLLAGTSSRELAGSARQGLEALDECAGVLYKEIMLRSQGAGLSVVIQGRLKSLQSVYRKMVRKKCAVKEVYDARALRVIVDDCGGTRMQDAVDTCYKLASEVHSIWRSLPREFDDYIANPKPSGYQALHTAVKGPGGIPMEVQIKTSSMHELAEFGAAAHWVYKEYMPLMNNARRDGQPAASASQGFSRQRGYVGQPVLKVAKDRLRYGVIISREEESGKVMCAVKNGTTFVGYPTRVPDYGFYRSLLLYAKHNEWRWPGRGDLRLRLEEYTMGTDNRYHRLDHMGVIVQAETITLLEGYEDELLLAESAEASAEVALTAQLADGGTASGHLFQPASTQATLSVAEAAGAATAVAAATTTAATTVSAGGGKAAAGAVVAAAAIAVTLAKSKPAGGLRASRVDDTPPEALAPEQERFHKQMQQAYARTQQLRSMIEWGRTAIMPEALQSDEVSVLIWPGGTIEHWPRGTAVGTIIREKGILSLGSDASPSGSGHNPSGALVNVNNRLVPENWVLNDGDLVILAREKMKI